MLKITFNVGEQVIMEGQEDSSSDSEADYEILDNQYDTIGDDTPITMDAEAALQTDYIPKNLIKVKMNGIIWIQDTPIDIDDQDCLWVLELKKTAMNKSYIHSKTLTYEWSYPNFLKFKKYINRSKPDVIYVFISILTHEIPSYYHKMLLSLGSRLNPAKIDSLDLYGWYYVCIRNKSNNKNAILGGNLNREEYKNMIQRGHFKNNQAIFGLLNNSNNIIACSTSQQMEKQQWNAINENVYPVILQDNGASNSSVQEYMINI